ncbi:MAG: hypothetical protein U1E27_02845, partial [Kiritimatiellia bacterium]|nr:hypothetical protein [Kiritimatiellia bacterium]
GLTDEIRNRVLDLLSEPSAGRPVERLARAVGIRAVLDDLESEIEKTVGGADESPATPKIEKDIRDARIRSALIERRIDLLNLLSDWQRDVLALSLGADEDHLRLPDRLEALRREAAPLDPAAALRRVQCVDDLHRRLERNLPVEWMLESFFQELDQTRAFRPEKEGVK